MEKKTYRRVEIDEVATSGSGIRLTPNVCGAGYPFIFRAANSVRWDEHTRSLYTLRVAEWSKLDAYQAIAQAVADEYGVELIATEHTRWIGISAETKAAIQRLGRRDEVR